MLNLRYVQNYTVTKIKYLKVQIKSKIWLWFIYIFFWKMDSELNYKIYCLLFYFIVRHNLFCKVTTFKSPQQFLCLQITDKNYTQRLFLSQLSLPNLLHPEYLPPE